MLAYFLRRARSDSTRCRAGGDRLHAVWLLFATTGIRRGEVAGLSWEDFDLDSGTLRVQWTLGLVGNRPTWKQQPKSRAGERTMALDPATVEALRQHRARQAEERLAWGPAWKRENPDERGNSRADLVFVHEDGRMINPERFSAWFRQAAAHADLPRFDFMIYAIPTPPPRSVPPRGGTR